MEIKECREEEDKHKNLYWFGNNPCLHPVPKRHVVLEISFQPCKSLYKQRSTRDVPSLVLFEQPSGCTLHLNWSTRDVPSLVLSITTQVDVPSTCATKDVPSNVLGQRILRRLVLWIFCKGEERAKRIQAISPSFFWQREKRMKKMNSTSFWTKNFSWKRKCW